MQHRESGHRVHRRAGEVVVVSDADEVRIGELVVEERIGERAVAVVGGPRALRAQWRHDRQRDAGDERRRALRRHACSTFQYRL
jgi:hypothetical protein